MTVIRKSYRPLTEEPDAWSEALERAADQAEAEQESLGGEDDGPGAVIVREDAAACREALAAWRAYLARRAHMDRLTLLRIARSMQERYPWSTVPLALSTGDPSALEE